MSQQTTIRTLAELVNTPVEKLLKQLAEAGMTFSGPDQTVTSAEKLKLLGFLKRSHGKGETATEDPAASKKITLNRNRKQEITVGGGKNRQTVDVVVRKKVTLVKQDGSGHVVATSAPTSCASSKSRASAIWANSSVSPRTTASAPRKSPSASASSTKPPPGWSQTRLPQPPLRQAPPKRRAKKRPPHARRPLAMATVMRSPYVPSLPASTTATRTRTSPTAART